MSSLFVVFLLFVFIFVPTVQAITQGDLNSIIQGTPYYEPESDQCSPTPINTSQTTYVIGDSLTVGMRDMGELSQKLTSGNLNSSQIEATVGISIGSSLAKIDADSANVKSATVAIVALGTNDARGATTGAISQKIQEMVQKIKSVNPSIKIYWVNLYSTVFDVSVANTAITQQASPLGYQVIDWSQEAKNNPTKYSFDASLGVHQTTAEGYSNMSDFVVQSVLATIQTTPVSTDLLGGDNIEKAYRYFLQKGLTANQSAGIVGNLGQESGVNPSSGYPNNNYIGIAQWDKGGRWARLVEWAGQTKDVLKLDTQLDYLWKEASERGNIDGIKVMSDIDHATWYWGRYFEVAIIGGSHDETPLTNVQLLDKRIKYAHEVYERYGGSLPGAPPSSGDCSATTGTGQDTRFIDGFTIYSQTDPAWKNSPYGSSTIGKSGCGPSAMAMIITALTGQKITPVDTANYAASKGLYIAGQGSSWGIGPVLAEHWGLKAEPIGADLARITSTLQAGGLVIAAGQGATPFTSGGHFIVIRAVTAGGKFRVGDSGHRNTSDQDWDPAPIISNMHGGSAYAITK